MKLWHGSKIVLIDFTQKRDFGLTVAMPEKSFENAKVVHVTNVQRSLPDVESAEGDFGLSLIS